MRDFDMHKQGWGRGPGFGHRSFAKPILIGIAFVALLALLVMSLWNAVLPALVGVNSIGFWQALGLLVLCRILFGGLGMRPGMFGRGRDRRRMHERWMQMTQEQREQFMQHRRGGGCHHESRGHHHGEHRGHGYGHHRGGSCDQSERRQDNAAAQTNAQEPDEQKSAGTERE